MKIELSVSIGLVGCKRKDVIEVDDDTTDDMIDEIVMEYIKDNIIEINWKRSASIETQETR